MSEAWVMIVCHHQTRVVRCRCPDWMLEEHRVGWMISYSSFHHWLQSDTFSRLTSVAMLPIFWPVLRHQRHRCLLLSMWSTLLQTRIGNERQNMLSTTRNYDFVEVEIHSERNKFVIEFGLLPNVRQWHWFGEAEWLMGKTNWSRTVIANKKLFHQLSCQDQKMIVEAEKGFAELTDDLTAWEN